MEVAFRYRNERQFLGSLSYDTFGCSGSMELNPGLSEVVFGLRAEVEALKTRLNKIERGQEVAVSAAYWQAVERERDSCLLYTSPSPRDVKRSRMPSSA